MTEAKERSDARLRASETLRRLAGFVAAAFDARYGFVAGFDGAAASPGAVRVTLWLARDFGLCPQVVRLDQPKALTTSASPDYLEVLRQVCANEPRLHRLSAASCLALPLIPPAGTLLGHLGFADTGPAFRIQDRQRLEHLVQRATEELRIWSESAPARD